jgi:hypothetical protein
MHPHLFQTLTSYTAAETEKLVEGLDSVLDVDWKGQDGFGKFLDLDLSSDGIPRYIP